MHLEFPAHLCFFWVACHPSRTFPPKELGQEPQNRLPPSPHCQTTPFLTFDSWPTAPILVGYELVVPKSNAALLPCESIACLVFTHLLLPVGLYGIAVCFTACLTFCGVGKLFILCVSFLLWDGYCFDVYFCFFQFSPYLFSPLVCGLTGSPTMPLRCSYHDTV